MNKLIIYYIIIVICSFWGVLLFPAQPMPLSDVRYWCYQIQQLDTQDAIQTIIDSKYDMVVIEPTVTYDPSFNASDMVTRIKGSMASDGVHRKLVIAYIDIGQAEEWRWYWDGHTTYEEQGTCRQSFIDQIQVWAPFVAACDPDGWAGNYPVAFWERDWKDVVIDGTNLGTGWNLPFSSMLEEVLNDGFDGVYLDWVEAWEMPAVQSRADNDGKDPGREMLNFIKEIRAYGKARNPNFLVIQQNSSELINEVGATELAGAVDGIAQEGVWWDGVGGNDDWTHPEGYDYQSCCTGYYLSRLRKYKAAGFAVFVADYALNHAEDVYQNAAGEGFIGYATRRSLSRLTTTPPNFSGGSTLPAADPFGSFDTPLDNTTVAGSVAVTGWALDDTSVSSVKLYRQGDSAQDLLYIGDAVMVEGARPDVQLAYPDYPNNSSAGWGYMMLTNFLPNSGNGTFVIHAVASDNQGNSVTLGTKTIICDNFNAVKPFGAIDTPAQGGSASGNSFLNWGWVLTPIPNSIPRDGSTIDVWVDGVKLGHPVYNIYRQDIADLFPYHTNSDGAVGYFYLDTSAYENGVHTIQWTATDGVGHSDGIGSRYFTIQNSSPDLHAKALTSHDVRNAKADHSPIAIKGGYTAGSPIRQVSPNAAGEVVLTIHAMERLEIHLPHAASGLRLLTPKPIGSTLDRSAKTFCWQLGPGFLGEHRLLFLYRNRLGYVIRKHVKVRIIP